MKSHQLIGAVIALVPFTAVLVDYIRLRVQRRRGCSNCAERAAEVMSDGTVVVDSLRLPSPTDSRWKEEIRCFSVVPIGNVDKQVLAIGDISVLVDQLSVFVGQGAALKSGKDYAERVITAYRQRLVDQSVKT